MTTTTMKTTMTTTTMTTTTMTTTTMTTTTMTITTMTTSVLFFENCLRLGINTLYPAYVLLCFAPTNGNLMLGGVILSGGDVLPRRCCPAKAVLSSRVVLSCQTVPR